VGVLCLFWLPTPEPLIAGLSSGRNGELAGDYPHYGHFEPYRVLGNGLSGIGDVRLLTLPHCCLNLSVKMAWLYLVGDLLTRQLFPSLVKWPLNRGMVIGVFIYELISIIPMIVWIVQYDSHRLVWIGMPCGSE
jgi:hypothetical protein